MIIDDIMTLPEVADYLKIAQKTVSRMIQRNEIPCMKVAGQWRFRRSVIDMWLNGKMNFSDEHNLVNLMSTDHEMVPLSRLISPEYIMMDIQPGTVEEVLSQLSQPLLKEGILASTHLLLSGLLARERMVSTAVYPGVAFPHIRSVRDNQSGLPPIVIGICREGTDYHALDGSLTHLFYMILANSETVHLRILAKLATATRKDSHIHNILAARSAEEVIRVFMEDEYEHLGFTGN